MPEHAEHASPRVTKRKCNSSVGYHIHSVGCGFFVFFFFWQTLNSIPSFFFLCIVLQDGFADHFSEGVRRARGENGAAGGGDTSWRAALAGLAVGALAVSFLASR